jgi:hypothetical protein
MTISQDEADAILEKHYDHLCLAVVDGYERYRKYPHRPLHRRSTRANIVNDEIIARIIEEFDGVPETKLVDLRSRGLRLLRVEDRILLWFKKTDRQRRIRIYPTLPAQQLESRGQIRLLPGLNILVVGYLLNGDETKVIRVSISKPKGHGLRPEWYIDLEPGENNNLVLMPSDSGPQTNRPRVLVKRGAVQLGLKNGD